MNTIEPLIDPAALADAIKVCEQEPIHQVGYIQPMGILLALDESDLRICHVSENIRTWFGFAPADLIGERFSSLVGEHQAESIRQLVGMQDWRRTAITSFKIVRNGVTMNLDAQVSRNGDMWIVEIEQLPRSDDDLFQKLFIPIRDALWQLDAETDISRYTQKVVEQVRLLTGYDRVMMYQFDESWDGEVIAESRTDEVESYLWNRFPASDIPAQARTLYTKNLVRLIADVDAAPVRVLPTLHPHTTKPLDMTYSSLRALSPIHLEYLRNMNVRATLTISLIQNNRLWGLIACHHTKPKYIPMRVRELDEFIGKTVSIKLSNLENDKKTGYHDQIRLLLEKMTHQIRQDRNIYNVIEAYNSELLSLVHADGAIINLEGKRIHIGTTPTDEQETVIDDWLKTLSPRNVFQTDNLTALYPTLKQFPDIACGLMIAPLDHQMTSYIAWFRSGITKTIRWAGNPDKNVKNEKGRLTISPRESFSTWVETFRDKSTPWSPLETDAAHALSLSIIEVLTHHALEQSEANYRFLADNSNDLIARFTAEGIYTFVSPASENLFGRAAQSMVGKPVDSFIALEDRAHFISALGALGIARDSETILFRPLHAKGRSFWLEYTLKRTVNPKTGAIEIVANGRDVTQRHTYQLAIEDLHRRNAMILESAGDGVISFDNDGRVVYANERAQRLMGWNGSLLDTTCCDLLPEQKDKTLPSNEERCPVLKSIRQQVSCRSEGSHFVRKDGRPLYVEYICTPMKGDSDSGGAVLVFNEIAEKELDHNQKQTRDVIINEASEAVMVTDAARNIVSVNRAFSVITGYPPEEAVGQTPRILKSGVHTPNFYDSLFTALKERHYWAGEIWNRRKNGEIYPQWGSITAILDESGNLKNYIAVFSDVSKAKQAEEKLYYLANHDSLTGLANRTKFVEHLNHSIERARRNPAERVAVAFIDLDRFKIINDTLGHASGDLYLKEIAQRISSVCRNHDLLSRWGGDEFVLAMDNVSSHYAITDAVNRIIDIVKRPLDIDGHELEPTLSVGISIFPEDADNTTDLVRAADTAMYRVKESGRNGYAFFTEHQADENKKKFEIVSELNRALRLNEFVMHYQPQVDTASGDIVGLEALIRWEHPERGYLSPAKFIPLAEELGLISQLGEWVLQAVCAQMAQWKMDGVRFPRVAVNISPSQLNFGLIELLQRTLSANGLSADLLELELTEGALEQSAEVMPILNQLREMGTSLSIDDFGTGYSSLAHLKRFPITCFKIDKSFIDGLPGNEQDAAIVKTILSLGNNFNVEVVVEGVETNEQCDFLTAIGAKTIQGYCFSKPLSVEEITKRLRVGGY